MANLDGLREEFVSFHRCEALLSSLTKLARLFVNYNVVTFHLHARGILVENDANGSCLSVYDAGSGNNRQSNNRGMVVNAMLCGAYAR